MLMVFMPETIDIPKQMLSIDEMEIDAETKALDAYLKGVEYAELYGPQFRSKLWISDAAHA